MLELQAQWFTTEPFNPQIYSPRVAQSILNGMCLPLLERRKDIQLLLATEAEQTIVLGLSNASIETQADLKRLQLVLLRNTFPDEVLSYRQTAITAVVHGIIPEIRSSERIRQQCYYGFGLIVKGLLR